MWQSLAVAQRCPKREGTQQQVLHKVFPCFLVIAKKELHLFCAFGRRLGLASPLIDLGLPHVRCKPLFLAFLGRMKFFQDDKVYQVDNEQGNQMPGKLFLEVLDKPRVTFCFCQHQQSSRAEVVRLVWLSQPSKQDT